MVVMRCACLFLLPNHQEVGAFILLHGVFSVGMTVNIFVLAKCFCGEDMCGSNVLQLSAICPQFLFLHTTGFS